MPSYGNCFSFNTYLSGDGLGGTRVASLTGPTYGLLLVLNIEQTKYMVNGLTKTVGDSFRYGYTTVHCNKVALSANSFVHRRPAPECRSTTSTTSH